jgi:hypothetical protein
MVELFRNDVVWACWGRHKEIIVAYQDAIEIHDPENVAKGERNPRTVLEVDA